jgi:hypothetical protein
LIYQNYSVYAVVGYKGCREKKILPEDGAQEEGEGKVFYEQGK